MVVPSADPDAGWMTPAAVAKAVGGRVVRTGRRALRVSTDTRDLRPGDLFVALVGEQFDAHDFVGVALRQGAAGVIVDRPLRDLPSADGGFVIRAADTGRALLALGAEHRRRSSARVVGITGSCGKTSTKDMLGGVLATAMPTVLSPKSYNNHVGVPLTLLSIEPDTRAAVVEIGTNAPGEIAALTAVAQPDVGLVTCVAEAHLARLGSLGGVAREKASLFEGVPADGVAILNVDDASCRAMAERVQQRVVTVALNRPADWFATDVSHHGLGTSFRLRGEQPVTLARVGSHNVYNALSTVAAAVELGMSVDAIVAALCRLPPSARRLEPKRFGDIQVYDDTYNSNIGSARAALDAVAGMDVGAGRRIVVLGDMLELGAEAERLHRELGRHVARSRIDVLVTIGPLAERIGDGARDAGLPARAVFAAGSRAELLELVLGILRPHDVVLFKASRRIGLDSVVDGLGRELAAGGRAVEGVR
ncbi:MAG: UDP-N-acetylmuramoyl-tripeptide--D-alanyl-D-alanine ligase [Planctomycetes bacterium]|nr:UDP-N-acetylmuramoyl-tripeptide--D-alanyl-D-alanine ligase [Planctomycetota bacterium]